MEKGDSVKIQDHLPVVFWDKASEKLLKWKNPENFTDKIHDLRVLGKKLRALYYFFQPLLGKDLVKGEKQKVKKAMSDLGAVRDSHVFLNIYRKIEQQYPRLILPKTLKPLLERHSQQLEQDPMLGIGKGLGTQKYLALAMDRILAAREKLLKKIAAKPFSKQLALDRMKKGLEAVTKTMKEAQKEGSADSFHRWRIKTKRFYYHLSLCWHGNGSKELEKIVKKFKQLEQHLGQAHDFHLLASFINSSHPGDLRDGEKDAFKEFLLLIGKLQEEEEKEALCLAKKLMDLGLEETIEKIFNP